MCRSFLCINQCILQFDIHIFEHSLRKQNYNLFWISEQTAELCQHIDQYIELIEIVEDISAIIKIDDFNESINIARELRENIALLTTEVSPEVNKEEYAKISKKQANLAFKLQTSISAWQVDVSDSAHELLSKINTNILQRIAQITYELQADLVAVTGVHVPVQASLELLGATTYDKERFVKQQESVAVDTELPQVVSASEAFIFEKVIDVKDQEIPICESSKIETREMFTADLRQNMIEDTKSFDRELASQVQASIVESSVQESGEQVKGLQEVFSEDKNTSATSTSLKTDKMGEVVSTEKSSFVKELTVCPETSGGGSSSTCIEISEITKGNLPLQNLGNIYLIFQFQFMIHKLNCYS